MTDPKQTQRHLDPEELSAFVDGELPSAETQKIQSHLQGCHGCTLQILSITQLRAAAKRAGERFVPSPETMARLTTQLRVADSKPSRHVSPPWFGFIAGWSLAAAAVILAILLIAWQRVHQADVESAELVDAHLSMLATGAETQVVSSDRHTVKPWFQGRLPFSFNLPEPDALPPGTTLRGANFVYLGGHPAALLVFAINKHEASIFVTQRNGGLAIAPRSERSGFALRSTTTSDLRLTAVSDVEPAALEALLGVLAKVQ